MIKCCFTFSIFIFVFLHGYSERNSRIVNPGDSIGIDDKTVTFPNNAGKERKVISVKESIYALKPAIDIPIVAVGTIWSGFAFTKIYKKSKPTVEEIQNLKTSDLNGFDRWAVCPYSKSLDDISYYPFYSAMPLPLIYFFTSKETRSDFARLTFLYWETMSVTGLLGTAATYNVDRYRPYAYSSETSMEKRTGRIVKNSFYSGHVQVVAAPTFFIAKVYADYHPDSKIKWVFYGMASAATGVTAYMRLKGGEHFPTDVLLGTVTGILAGIMVPQYHKTKSAKKSDMSIMPYSTGDINGLVCTYKINK